MCRLTGCSTSTSGLLSLSHDKQTHSPGFYDGRWKQSSCTEDNKDERGTLAETSAERPRGVCVREGKRPGGINNSCISCMTVYVL